MLYETALGVGIACGPLLGGLLGEVSWRGPFVGVSVLMTIALVATVVLVDPTPTPQTKSSIKEPLVALRHRSLAMTSPAGLLYNWCFFTILGYAPFLMDLSPTHLGLVFFGWGLMVAVFAVFGAPYLKGRFGTPQTLYGSFAFMAAISLAIGIWSADRWVVIGAVVASGIVIGLNNTLVTTAVMSIAPVPRPVASATYGFVRFIGGGLAPFAAGKLVETTNVHVPFLLGAGAVLAAAFVLTTVHRALVAADEDQLQPGPSHERQDAQQAVFGIPGIEEEAVLAAEALHEDARLDPDRPSVSG